jgi:50S ribosomal protein L4
MAESTKLPKDIFAVEVPNHELLKLAYDSYLANARLASATTKQRGEVSGGGKKPWKQKGTGRARFGSTRNPIWRGGGVVFGPRGNENYTKKMSKTAKKVAIRQALTVANEAKKISVIETFACPNGKVKETLKLLADNNAADLRRVLIVVSVKDELVLRATNNLQNVKAIQANYLNVYDILNADKILLSKKSLDILKSWLGKEEA